MIPRKTFKECKINGVWKEYDLMNGNKNTYQDVKDNRPNLHYVGHSDQIRIDGIEQIGGKGNYHCWKF